ncbi:MAG: hypothetical protein QM775_16840 [Pirellulales bacterium]
MLRIAATNGTNNTTFGGAITLNNHLTLDDTAAPRVLVMSGALNATGTSSALTVTKGSGAGSVTLSGALTVGSGGLTFLSTGSTTAGSVLTLSGAISGTGDITFSNNTTVQNGVTVSNASINNTGAIRNVGTGTGNTLVSGNILTNVTSVQQNGTSPLELGGVNTYTGPTTVTSGTLVLTGSASANGSLAGTAISVASAGTIVVQGSSATLNNYTIGATGSPTLSIATGGTLSLVDALANTLTINSATAGATVLSLANGSQLVFDVGPTADSIQLGSGLLAAIASGGVVTVVPYLFGPLTSGSFTLISAPGGGLISGGLADFQLSTTSLGGATLGLTITDTALVLNVTNPNNPTTLYFKGGVAGSTGGINATWNGFVSANTNWTTDASGTTNAQALPSSVTDVHFYAAGTTTANLTTVLGQNVEVRTLTLDGGTLTQAVSIVGTIPNTSNLNTLTITPLTPGAGITANSGAGADDHRPDRLGGRSDLDEQLQRRLERHRHPIQQPRTDAEQQRHRRVHDQRHDVRHR